MLFCFPTLRATHRTAAYGAIKALSPAAPEASTTARK